jgi:S1-C subfamily serine protease
MFFVASACVSAGFAQPVAVSPRWQVNFPPAANGRPGESTAVPVNGASMLVAIVAAGANPVNPALQFGSRSIPVKMIGHDAVSRLGFIKVEGSVVPKSMEWAADAGASASATLQAMEPAGLVKCRATGWVKQVGGKILPLALLRVNFSHSVPPPGTPLLDDAGRVVAIVFQSSGGGNVGYALPAEAVHRVLRDISSGGQLSRGWLGLALRAESQIPRISRVLPDSPAAAAGVQPNDVLLSIGSRQIADYADAANAFFYLIPGQPVRVKLLRGVEQLEVTLTPTMSKG